MLINEPNWERKVEMREVEKWRKNKEDLRLSFYPGF